MDTIRFLLFVALGLVSLMIWQAWQEDYGRPDPLVAERDDLPGVVVTEEVEGLPALPREPDAAIRAAPEEEPLLERERVRVVTDVYDIEIDTRGGDIRHAQLLEYPIAVDKPDQPFQLLTDSGPLVYVIQGGLLSEQQAPNHRARYRAERDEYRLEDQVDELEVRLSWAEDEVQVDKVYTFRRGEYVIDVRYEVTNLGERDWRGWAYGQLRRNDPTGGGMRLLYTYTGAAISSPDKRYDKIRFRDMRDRDLERRITNGWAAMLQHYFVTALIPADPEQEHRYYTMVLNRDAPDPRDVSYIIGASTPPLQLAPGDSGSIQQRLYAGPKMQHILADVAPSLELTVDYGYLWFISKPLFWCLERLKGLTGNWGWAIILLTILIKILFYKLSAAGYRSMANMRRVQPRLLALRDRYANDKQRLNQAMMDLYKKEKINPLGGCLPILVQIPVFIALYWVLLESVELRQADFILWIQDLSIPDPFFVLPIVMGVTMFIQQKLNPAPLDPVQQKIMMSLPIVFTVFFAFFPAGLVLYWVVNNILSIGQQWLITRNLEKESGATNA